MAFTWHGTAHAEAVVNLGPLALIRPLLDQLDIAGIIDRHVPPDPQREFSHGQVLSLLLAARIAFADTAKGVVGRRPSLHSAVVFTRRTSASWSVASATSRSSTCGGSHGFCAFS